MGTAHPLWAAHEACGLLFFFLRTRFTDVSRGAQLSCCGGQCIIFCFASEFGDSGQRGTQPVGWFWASAVSGIGDTEPMQLRGPGKCVPRGATAAVAAGLPPAADTWLLPTWGALLCACSPPGHAAGAELLGHLVAVQPPRRRRPAAPAVGLSPAQSAWKATSRAGSAGPGAWAWPWPQAGSVVGAGWVGHGGVISDGAGVAAFSPHLFPGQRGPQGARRGREPLATGTALQARRAAQRPSRCCPVWPRLLQSRLCVCSGFTCPC